MGTQMQIFKGLDQRAPQCLSAPEARRWHGLSRQALGVAGPNLCHPD